MSRLMTCPGCDDTIVSDMPHRCSWASSPLTVIEEERDRYRDALRILRVTADFHQRNIIDKALGA